MKKPILSNLDLGYLTEKKIIIKLLENNFNIFEPLHEGGVVDFITYKNKIFNRIQAKTAQYEKSYDRYKSSLLKTRHQTYKDNDFDFFIICIYETNDYYVIPLSATNTTAINFYPHRDKLGKSNYEVYKNNFSLLEN